MFSNDVRIARIRPRLDAPGDRRRGGSIAATAASQCLTFGSGSMVRDAGFFTIRTSLRAADLA